MPIPSKIINGKKTFTVLGISPINNLVWGLTNNFVNRKQPRSNERPRLNPRTLPLPEIPRRLLSHRALPSIHDPTSCPCSACYHPIDPRLARLPHRRRLRYPRIHRFRSRRTGNLVQTNDRGGMWIDRSPALPNQRPGERTYPSQFYPFENPRWCDTFEDGGESAVPIW